MLGLLNSCTKFTIVQDWPSLLAIPLLILESISQKRLYLLGRVIAPAVQTIQALANLGSCITGIDVKREYTLHGFLMEYNLLVQDDLFGSSPAPSSAVPKCKLLQTSRVQWDRLIAEAMSSPASSDKDEVEQHFRTKHGAQTSITLQTANICPIYVKLGIAPGSIILLGANLDKQLVGLKSAHSIDRYIAVTVVWREIKWNTPICCQSWFSYCCEGLEYYQ
ncbi:hypothetical protein BT96DRAFT_942529 [Gymnopus androsaceus JB14]|uniref:Uncharacterized protein n=1 Tax=Gymnopus androsaceus JB14 TaxID=1447944 RepID=A0A6A4HC74_9AGAR|nr:hypothetical protein BT96DRAFT_942529 [Gymnopus androsaceus JB14]